jgi:hypothetical protein
LADQIRQRRQRLALMRTQVRRALSDLIVGDDLPEYEPMNRTTRPLQFGKNGPRTEVRVPQVANLDPGFGSGRDHRRS